VLQQMTLERVSENRMTWSCSYAYSIQCTTIQ